MFTARSCLFQAEPAGLKCKGSRTEVAVPSVVVWDLPLEVAGGVRAGLRGWSPAPAPGRAFSPLLPWAPQVALCFSPVGNKLRVRSRRFPAIVSCVAIDWFQEWPREALESVSLRFLRETATVEVSTAGAARAVPGFEFFCGPQAVATPHHAVLVAAGCDLVPPFRASNATHDEDGVAEDPLLSCIALQRFTRTSSWGGIAGSAVVR